MKIAIIGAGISGLGAAFLLDPRHDVTVFEKNSYTGGHSRTIDVHTSKTQKSPVDTGFIVFNDRNYPNLLGLFDTLKVPYEKSDMSFGVSIKNGWLEYSSKGMLVQRRNILRPSYWKMVFDILRFNKKALAYIDKSPQISLAQCLDELNMGEWFKNYYLLAMGAAIWSCPIETIMQFPAKTFLQFFKNHGLLTVNGHPQWYTVTGGSREYVRRIKESLSGKIHNDYNITKVTKIDEGFEVSGTDKSSTPFKETFEHVIFACHADEALAMIDNPTASEKDVLGSFRYQENTIITHTDESFMPKRRDCWASWIYLSEEEKDTSPVVSLSYWMNNLQNFESDDATIVTLNPGRRPRKDLIQDVHTFSHPIFDAAAINAQSEIQNIQGQRGLWFCGAYQRYGFHEDGLLSAVKVAKKMGVAIPWQA